MADCDFCNKQIVGLSHACKYCGKKHCANCLQPELHDCTGRMSNPHWNNSKLSDSKKRTYSKRTGGRKKSEGKRKTFWQKLSGFFK